MTTAGEINVKLGLNSETFIKSMDNAERELKALEGKLKQSQKHFEAMSKAMAVTKKPTEEMKNAFERLKKELQHNKSAYNDFQIKLKELDGGLIQGKTKVDMLRGAIGKLVAGGTIALLGKQLIDFSKQSVAAFREQDRALKSLDTALQNAGVYTGEYSSHLKKLSAEIQSFSNYGDEAVERAIGLGQAYAGNIELTDDLIKATVDFAAATDTDLQTAFTLVGKSIGTSTNALARYGVKLDDSMTKEQKEAEIQRVLGERFKGSAKDMSDASIQLNDATSDLAEAFGALLNPAVEDTQNWLISAAKELTNWITKVRVLKSEISNLKTVEDIELRIKEQTELLKRLQSQKTSFLTKERQKEIANDIDLAKVQLEKIKALQDKIAEESKNKNKGLGEGTNTGSGIGTGTKQDKTLEAYKKFIEEYAKLNDDYAATLKARQYVEGTLNINPITQAEEYNKMITLYQAHLSKIAEIRRSGTAKQADIEKLQEEKLAQDLQTLKLDKERETQRKLQEIIQGYKNTQADIRLKSEAEQQLGGFIGSFTVGYQKRLEVLQWYLKERENLQSAHYANLAEQTEAFNQLEQTKQMQEAQIAKDIWTQRSQDIAGIFNQTFSSMLTNYGDFGDNMKQLAINLSTYLTKEVAKAAFTWLIESQKQQGGILANFINQISNLSSSLTQVGQSGQVAATGVTAAQTAQTAMKPVQAALSATSKITAQEYIKQATAAQQLAVATTQLAISEAALSVAKIPYVGGFLAPAVAVATGAAIAAAVAMVSAASLFSKVGNIGGATSNVLPTHHSGGMIPGTKEQIAVLQGGERVLNRAETNSYNNNESSGDGDVNNIMVFNIKAWDGRDVIDTLKANEQTINQIVSSGIKNNKQGLRTIVQNT